MHAEIDRLLAAQHELVAHWQLVRLPDRPPQVVIRGLRRAQLRTVDHGVWTASRMALTARQRRMAATLTAPDTAVAMLDAAAEWGAGEHAGTVVVVVRPGTGGPRRHADVLVRRTRRFVAMSHLGVPVTPPARTLMDLAPHVAEFALRRAAIEMLRLRAVPCTLADLQHELAVGRHRPGAPRLRTVVEQLAELPIERTRSNAEGEALVRRKAAGRAPVEVNVRVAGYEADLVDRERRTIIEIDGPAFHADPDRDARRDAAWREAGFTVVRRPSDDAYDPAARW